MPDTQPTTESDTSPHTGVPLWLFVLGVLLAFAGGAALSALLLMRKQATKVTVQTVHSTGALPDHFMINVGFAPVRYEHDLERLSYTPGPSILVERGEEGSFEFQTVQHPFLRKVLPAHRFEMLVKGDPDSSTSPLTIISR